MDFYERLFVYYYCVVFRVGNIMFLQLKGSTFYANNWG
jgi:hypothetical protein